jgi:hypothetical protein
MRPRYFYNEEGGFFEVRICRCRHGMTTNPPRPKRPKRFGLDGFVV